MALFGVACGVFGCGGSGNTGASQQADSVGMVVPAVATASPYRSAPAPEVSAASNAAVPVNITYTLPKSTLSSKKASSAQ